jgi:glycosyltransferase 2 family protein
MKKKHAITTAIVLAVLAGLVYSQFRHWRSFDWQQFWAVSKGVNLWMVFGGVVLIYLADVLRAVRWKLFLAPTCETTVARLIPSQFIGFTGLALLGRPGELVRPYLVARKENLTFSSQLAVWAIERVFDISAVAILMGITLAIWGDKFKAYPQVQTAGYLLLGLAAALALIFFLVWWRTKQIANILDRLIRPRSENVADAVCRKVCAFGEGLHTIRDLKSFVLIALVSLCLWVFIARAYIQVMHSYPVTMVEVQAESDDDDDSGGAVITRTVRLHEMKLEDALLVMGASMAGSIVQLPGVGGGSQLAVIELLSSDIFKNEPYNITRELAVSCGMLCWLVTFMAVIPAGLIMAHRERISLRMISRESAIEATQAECSGQAPKVRAGQAEVARKGD